MRSNQIHNKKNPKRNNLTQQYKYNYIESEAFFFFHRFESLTRDAFYSSRTDSSLIQKLNWFFGKCDNGNISFGIFE